MASASSGALFSPAATQILPDPHALRKFQKTLAAQNDSDLSLSTLLDRIRNDPLFSKDLDLVLEKHAKQLAPTYFACDVPQAYRVLKLALKYANNSPLLWGALRDLFSPFSQNNALLDPSMANNDPITAILSAIAIDQPTAETLFGSFNYVECNPDRSILSPPAYLVDLLRLIASSQGFGESDNATQEDGARPFLRQRRPDIYQLLLSPENTFDTIPYLDIVNDALSAIIINENNKSLPQSEKSYDAFQILSHQVFPFKLPFHRSLSVLRSTLEKMGYRMQDIIRSTRQTSIDTPIPNRMSHSKSQQPLMKREFQEMLGLSMDEWNVVTSKKLQPLQIAAMYGRTPSNSSEDYSQQGFLNDFLRSLADIDVFMGRTGLNRKQVQQLVYQDLSKEEIVVGQSSVFYVNDVDDGKESLSIVMVGDEFKSDGKAISERVENLSWKKLDRIHRFIRLANRLKWSFSDLDWALQAANRKVVSRDQEQTLNRDLRVLFFDGVNDFLTVNLKSSESPFISSPVLTIEGWVYPIRDKSSTRDDTSIMFAVWIPDKSASLVTHDAYVLVYLNSALEVCVGNWGSTGKSFTTLNTLTENQFSHVCVQLTHSSNSTVNGDSDPITVLINGTEQPGILSPISPPTPPKFAPEPGFEHEGHPFLTFGQKFCGYLKEIRAWDYKVSKEDVKINMLRAMTGYENHLLGCWPLSETFLGRIVDRTVFNHSGVMGGGSAFSVPTWASEKLFLDSPGDLVGYSFNSNSLNNYLEADLTKIVDISSEEVAVSFWASIELVKEVKNTIMSWKLLGADNKKSSLELHADDKGSIHLSIVANEGSSSPESSLLVKSTIDLNANDIYIFTVFMDTSDVGLSIRPGQKLLKVKHKLENVGKPLAMTVGRQFRGLLHDIKVWSTSEHFDSSFDPLSSHEQLRAHWELSREALEFSPPIDKLMITDTENNGVSLLGRARIEFSPKTTSEFDVVYIREKTKRDVRNSVARNSGTALFMSSKSAVVLSNGKNAGLGRRKNGTIGLWFKTSDVSPFERQLLFAHGSDDVGITIYIVNNKTLAVSIWSRTYDGGKRSFRQTELYHPQKGDAAIPLSEGEWSHVAVSFKKKNSSFEELYSVAVYMNGIEMVSFVDVPLSPSGEMILGGIPLTTGDNSTNWVVFDGKTEGNYESLRTDVFFSGSLLGFNYWVNPLDETSLSMYLNLSELASSFLAVQVPLFEIESKKGNIDNDQVHQNHVELAVYNLEWKENSCGLEDYTAKLFRQEHVLLSATSAEFASSYSFLTLPKSFTEKLVLKGRMRCSFVSSGIGVIICSGTGDKNGDTYREGIVMAGRIHEGKVRFAIIQLPNPVSPLQELSDGVDYDFEFAKDVWFRFEITCQPVGDNNNVATMQVSAKIWPQFDVEPQRASLMSSFPKLDYRQVGLWSFGNGEQAFDDFIAYNQGQQQELFFEGFDDVNNSRLIAWKDYQSHIVDSKSEAVTLQGTCIGWDTDNQSRRMYVKYDAERSKILRTWRQPGTVTTISGRMMFENDGGSVGVWFGSGDADGHSWRLVRSPFGTARNSLSRDLDNVYKFRLELSARSRSQWYEIPYLVPVHSRWYQFSVEFSAGTSSDAILKVMVWEDGGTQPGEPTLVRINWSRTRRDEFLGLVGGGTGRKYIADVVSVTTRSGQLLQTLKIGNTFEKSLWTGNDQDMIGFGSLQPIQALVGTPIQNELGSYSLYVPMIPDEDQRLKASVRFKMDTMMGRIYRKNATDSFGFTLMNRMPINENVFYRVDITSEVPYVRAVAGYGDLVALKLVESNGSNLKESHGWYYFRLDIEEGVSVKISGKVWKTNIPEPEIYTFVVIDDSEHRLTSGAPGFWSNNVTTLFEGLIAGTNLGREIAVSEVNSWNQFTVRTERSIFGVSFTNVEQISRFSHEDESVVCRTLGIEKAYACVPLLLQSGFTVSAQVQIDTPGAQAGFILYGTNSSSDTIAVTLETNSAKNIGSTSLSWLVPGGQASSKSFQALGGWTRREREMMNIEPEVKMNVLINLRSVETTENKSLLRISVKCWSAIGAQPSHFALVGYSEFPESRSGFGLYCDGGGLSRFSNFRFRQERDMLPSGNNVRPLVNWINMKRKDMRGENIAAPGAFEVVSQPETLGLYLEKNDRVPLIEPFRMLKFAGDTGIGDERSDMDIAEFMTASLQEEHWTFHVSVVVPDSKGPIFSVPHFRFNVTLAGSEGNGTKLYVEYGEQRHVHDLNVKTETIDIVAVSTVTNGMVVVRLLLKSNTDIVEIFSGEASEKHLLGLTELSLPTLFVGRGYSEEVGKHGYFNGHLYDVLLLSRVLSPEQLIASEYLPFGVSARREDVKGSLMASWPGVNGKEFLLGGDQKLWTPGSVAKSFPKPLQSLDSASFSGDDALYFGKNGGLRLPLAAVRSGEESSLTEIRQRTVHVVFKATNVYGQSEKKKQVLYSEGQLGIYIVAGHVEFRTGDSSYSQMISDNDWCSVTLVWDAARENRTGALMCYFNGLPVAIRPGKLLRSSGNNVLIGTEGYSGSIYIVNVFATALDSYEVQRLDSLQSIAELPPAIVLSLNANNVDMFASSGSNTVIVRPVSSSVNRKVHWDSIHELMDSLAFTKSIVDSESISVVDAVLPWGAIKDYGVSVGRNSKMDALFNTAYYGSGARWGYGMKPEPFTLDGNKNSDWINRNRLANVSQHEPSELNVMLELSNMGGVIDGSVLTRFINTSSLAQILEVTPTELKKLLNAYSGASGVTGPQDVVFLQRTLAVLRDAGFEADQILYHLGVLDPSPISGELISEIAMNVIDEKDAYAITKEAFAIEFLTEAELKRVFDALKNPSSVGGNASDKVLSETGLVTVDYFSGDFRKSIRQEGKWVDLVGLIFRHSFEQDFDGVLNDESLKQYVTEFSSAKKLREVFDELGFIFGERMYKPYTLRELQNLLSLSRTEGFVYTLPEESNERTNGANKILTALMDRVFAVWALKTSSLEDLLGEKTSAMHESLFQAISSLTNLDFESIRTVVHGGYGGTAYDMVEALFKILPTEGEVNSAPKPVEAVRMMLFSALKVTRLTVSLTLIDEEIEALIFNPHIFDLSRRIKLDDLDKSSLFTLAMYRYVREHIVEQQMKHYGTSVNESTKMLLKFLESKPRKLLSAARLLDANSNDVQWILEQRGSSDVTVEDLWHFSTVGEITNTLGASAEVVWNLASAQEYREYSDLVPSITESMRAFCGSLFDRNQNEIEANLLGISRDALLAFAITKVTEDVKKYALASVLLGEYLLLDVETGPPVLASRVQQAIQSVQLYIHRTLLGLERTNIGAGNVSHVRSQWDSWLQNYRVWEAARRVYLYPENYLEPDLRSSMSPPYEALVKRLSGGTDERSISSSVLDYVSSVQKELSNLRIAGAGQSTSIDFKTDDTFGLESTGDTSENHSEKQVERLILVGRTRKSPVETYVRQRITSRNEDVEGDQWSWQMWEKVDTDINAEWISPVFAFGKLHLMWIAWKQDIVQYYLFDRETKDDLFGEMERNGRKTPLVKVTSNKSNLFWLLEKDILPDEIKTKLRLRENSGTGEKEEKDLTIVTAPKLEPQIQYVSQRGFGSWTTSQPLVVPNIRLRGNVKVSEEEVIIGEHSLPSWQQLYCTRVRLNEKDTIREPRTITDVRVFVASKSTIPVSMITTMVVTEKLLFDVLFRLRPIRSSSYKVYQDLKKIELPNERSLNDISYFSVPLAPTERVALLRAPEEFSFYFALQRNDVFAKVIHSLDETIKKWEKEESSAAAGRKSIEEKYDGDDKNPMKKIEISNLEQKEAYVKAELRNNLIESVELLRASLLGRGYDADKILDSTDLETLQSLTNIPTAKLERLTNTDVTKILKISVETIYKISFHFKEREEYDPVLFVESSEGNEPGIIILPRQVLNQWSHLALDISFIKRDNQSSLSVTLRSRTLMEGSSTETKNLVLDTDGESLAVTVFEVGGKIGESPDEPRDIFNCELAEARIWVPEIPEKPENSPFGKRFERFRLDLSDSRNLIGVLSLNNTRDIITNEGVQRFTRTDSLTLWKRILPAEEFDEETILAFYNGRVYSIQSNSDNPYEVELRDNQEFPCLQITMHKTGNPAAGGLGYYVRSRPPQFEKDELSGLLGFYTGLSGYNIDAGKLYELQRPLWRKELRYYKSLLHNLRWSSATVQPVQDRFDAVIVETGEDIFILEAVPTDGKKLLRSKMSEHITLTKTDDGDLSMVLSPGDGDVHTELKFMLQRVSSSLGTKFENRMATGGVNWLFHASTAEEKESAVVYYRSGKYPKLGVIVIPAYVLPRVFLAEGPSTRTPSMGYVGEDVSQRFNAADFDGINGPYLWELFLHVPLLVANTLNASGQYEKAKKWFEYVFRPNTNKFDLKSYNPWLFKPFASLPSGNDAILSVLGDTSRTSAFRENPFDAHIIASGRQYAYQKTTFMKYTSNMLDYADSLFIDDRESINRALLIYIQALKVLGQKPREIPRSRVIKNTSPRTIEVLRREEALMADFIVPKDDLNPVGLMVSFCVPENDMLLGLWDRVQDRLYKVRNSLNIEGVFRQLDLFAPPIDPAALVSAVAGGSTAIASASDLNRAVPHYRFDYMLQNAISAAETCAAMGEGMLSALEKRDSERITLLEADQARTLNLFVVEISRKNLEASRYERAAVESRISRIVASIQRYEGYLGKGYQFEGQYTAASLGIVRSGISAVGTMQPLVSRANAEDVENKNAKIEKALAEKNLIKKDKDEDAKSKRIQKGIYDKHKKEQAEIRRQKKESEKAAKALLKVKTRQRSDATADLTKSASLKTTESVTRSSAAGLNVIPEVQTGTAGLGPLVAAKFGGEKLAKGLEIASDIIGLTTTVIDIYQQAKALEAQKEADKHGWEKELASAKIDLTEATNELSAAIVNEQAADLALLLSTAEGTAAELVYTAHRIKFTNKELYSWLSSEMKKMYRKAYNVTVGMAKSAQRGLQFELPTDRKFISGSGWSDVRNGLLAAQILQSELRAMDNYRVEQDSRFLELERIISLRRDMPGKLEELVRFESCEFDFTEQMFDQDYPGHYFRILKTVAVTVKPAASVVTARNSLRATLTQTSNHVVMANDIGVVQYLLNGSGEAPNSSQMRSNWRANQSVALSKWTEDTGMFNVNYVFDDRYFSFEGTGAVSKWNLSIEANANKALAAGSAGEVKLGMLDPAIHSNVDIIFKLQYSCKSDAGKFQQDVRDAVEKIE